MKLKKVERRQECRPDEFAREFISGAGTPVIITDAASDWPALSKWTFQHFKAAYGTDFVPVMFCGLESVSKLVSLSDFVDHICEPETPLAGLWVGKGGLPTPAPHPAPTGLPYLMAWYGFQRHPELYEDILPAPAFTADWVLGLSPAIRDVWQAASNREYWSVYFGPAGTVTDLHQDYWGTHGCLTQIQGTKRVLLFSPEDTPFLYDGRVDPERPDFARCPLLEQATAYECELRPGESLFMPSGWWHWVRALEKSITVSHNFFNESNFDQHMKGLMRSLPELVREINRSESTCRALDISWDNADFISTGDRR